MSTGSADKRRRLTLFDLDHTLLDGDSDVLWCDFLIAHGLLDRDLFSKRNQDMEVRYKAGTVGVQEFADFYMSTLAGRTPSQWAALRQHFFTTQVRPRIPEAATALVQQHRAAGDTLLMTTATNRFITELTATHFGISHLLATEPEIVDGHFTGRTLGAPNMREGKVQRLHQWLSGQGLTLNEFHSSAYSDSINDLPLLEAVDRAVCVDPDPALKAAALQRGWEVLVISGPGAS